MTHPREFVVVHQPGTGQFWVGLDGMLAVLQYRRGPGKNTSRYTLVFAHTDAFFAQLVS